MNTKDFRIKSRIKNNRLLKAIEDYWYKHHDRDFNTIKELYEFVKEQSGVSIQLIARWVNFTKGKRKLIPTLKNSANRLSKFFKIELEELFPEWMYLSMEKNEIEFELDRKDILSLEGKAAELMALPEFIQSEDNISKDVERNLLKKTIAKAMDILNPREQKIITMHFGLNGGRPHTHKEIGEEFGVGGGQIGNLINRAIQKLQEDPKNCRLRAFCDNPPSYTYENDLIKDDVFDHLR